MSTPELAPLPKSGQSESEPTLLEQAADLSRAQIMKRVVCEPLSRELADLFSPLSEQEHESLQPIPPQADITNLQRWITKLVEIVGRRANPSKGRLNDIFTLNMNRNIFYYDQMYRTLSEGIRSGIHVPVLLGAQVYMVEKQTPPQDESLPLSHVDDSRLAINLEDMLTIMERPTFAAMLRHLTKGPNGFLGASSTSVDSMPARSFFAFNSPSEPGHKLSYAQALEMHDGEVIGLSSQYFLAAHRRRQRIKVGESSSAVMAARDGYKPHDSSGCPVRHAYRDERGEMQEPLIFTAKDFVIRTMRENLGRSKIASSEAVNS